MNDHSPLDENSRQLEEIVAYLDGELSPEESARVERELAADESYRQSLQSLQRAWAALDELPAATVDDRFSQTTMAMVVESARNDVAQQTRALPIRQRKQRLSGALLLTAAALLGALAFRLIVESPNRALKADLPVIQYLDIYSQFRDVQFLRQLSKQLSANSWSFEDEPDEVTAEVEQFRQIVAVEHRMAWLDTLTDDQRVALRAKFNRFRSMPDEQQERLRSLHRQIELASDATDLRRTMLAYQQWLDGLSASQQFELRELSLSERVRKVVSLVRVRETSFQLAPDELRELFHDARPQWLEMRDRRRLPARNVQEARELVQIVREALPEEKREQFDQLTTREQLQHFSRWMLQAVRQREAARRPGERRRPDQITEQQLEQFFVEEVDAATKEQLLAMPRDKMQHQLRQMYRGKLPMPAWDGLGEPGERERPRRGPPRGGERRRTDGPPPRPLFERGPFRFREDRPGPPPDERSPG